MNGMLNIVMVVATIFVAVMTYQVKFKARTLELDIRVLHKQNQTLKSDLSILRAEKSYLSRPERIERLAQKFLSLSVTIPQRSVSHDILLSQRLEVESEQSALLALQAMQKHDQDRQKDFIKESDQNKKISSVKSRKFSTTSAVMGMVQRDKGQLSSGSVVTKPSVQIEDQNKIIERPEKKVKPDTPRWTYYGGIGDDD